MSDFLDDIGLGFLCSHETEDERRDRINRACQAHAMQFTANGTLSQQSHTAPPTCLDIEQTQLLEHFQACDAYGRRVALTLLAELARLKAGAA